MAGTLVWRPTFCDLAMDKRQPPAREFGPFTLQFSLQGNEAGIQFVLERVQLWSIPLPRLMRPHVDAREASADGKHLFNVELSLPGLGRIVRYSGRLTPAS